MAKKPKKSRAMPFQVLTTIKWICGETVMLCPICRCTYIHFRNVEMENHSQACLKFWCENGHDFSYIFRFAKGHIVLELQTQKSGEC